MENKRRQNNNKKITIQLKNKGQYTKYKKNAFLASHETSESTKTLILIYDNIEIEQK